MFKSLIQAIKDFFKKVVARVKGQVKSKVDQATTKINDANP